MEVVGDVNLKQGLDPWDCPFLGLCQDITSNFSREVACPASLTPKGLVLSSRGHVSDKDLIPSSSNKSFSIDLPSMMPPMTDTLKLHVLVVNGCFYFMFKEHNSTLSTLDFSVVLNLIF